MVHQLHAIVMFVNTVQVLHSVTSRTAGGGPIGGLLPRDVGTSQGSIEGTLWHCTCFDSQSGLEEGQRMVHQGSTQERTLYSSCLTCSRVGRVAKMWFTKGAQKSALCNLACFDLQPDREGQ